MNVAIIPARGNSQRIPRKNIRLFDGIPIMAHSIRTAFKCGLFDRVIVSTDDDEIAAVAKAESAEVFRRPLCNGIMGTQLVTAQALRDVPCDYACCIYATAPLLCPIDLMRGFDAVIQPGADFAYSVGVRPHTHDAGQFYWGRREAFINGVPLDPMGMNVWKVEIANERDCDINTKADWRKAEKLYQALRRAKP